MLTVLSPIDCRTVSPKSLSRSPYSVAGGEVAFNHDGQAGSGFYCCTLHKPSGKRQLLGAIKRDPTTYKWFITHVERLAGASDISYDVHTEAVDHLITLQAIS